MTTLAQRPATATALLETTAKLAEADRRFWIGMSGETVTGEQVARHLEATAELLYKRGWSRTYALSIESGTPEPEFPSFDDVETLTIKAILLRLLKFARDLYVHENSWTATRSLTLSCALHEANDGVHGDSDTWYVAGHLLAALLKASNGGDLAQFAAWSSKIGRTQEEVLLLIDTGAAFARQYGPQARATFLAA